MSLSKVEEGYVLVWCPNHPNRDAKGYLREHRLVVEEFIGRYLTEKEVVHHIDNNSFNNEIDNLMVFQNNKEHASFHNKIRRFGFTNPVKRQINNRWIDLKKLDEELGR